VQVAQVAVVLTKERIVAQVTSQEEIEEVAEVNSAQNLRAVPVAIVKEKGKTVNRFRVTSSTVFI
jgi:hypothetical protein